MDNKHGYDLPAIPEWDPEWDFLEPEEIERQLSEREEEGGALRSFMKAIDDLTSGGDDPNHAIPEQSQNAVAPVFDAVMKAFESEDEKFLSQDTILNFKQYKALHKALRFAKSLEIRELASNITVDFRRSKVHPATVSFETYGVELIGSDITILSDILERAAAFSLTRTLNDTIVVNFSFNDLWLTIENAAKNAKSPNVL